MFNLESLLASKLLAKKQLSKVTDTEIVLDEDSNKIYFVFRFNTGKVKKDGTEQVRVYKNDITKYVANHGGLENLFKTLVAAEMMLSGYMIIPIPGGYLCVGGEEMYDLKDDTCTCPAFINNSKEPCKHLLYKDALLLQRARINQWKEINLR